MAKTIANAYIPGIGFREKRLAYAEIHLGVYERYPSLTRGYGTPTTQWRVRKKRRGAGHTWKRVADLPKEMKLEALILDFDIN